MSRASELPFGGNLAARRPMATGNERAVGHRAMCGSWPPSPNGPRQRPAADGMCRRATCSCVLAALARPGRCLDWSRQPRAVLVHVRGAAGTAVVGRFAPGEAIVARTWSSATEAGSWDSRLACSVVIRFKTKPAAHLDTARRSYIRCLLQLALQVLSADSCS